MKGISASNVANDSTHAFTGKFELIRSKRKTVALTVTKELKPLVRAPLRMPLREIEEFVCRHADWLQKQLIELERREKQFCNSLTSERITELKQEAAVVLPQRAAYYAEQMGVSPAGVKITSAKTRYGSCSYKNSICFSYRLMLFPIEQIDYVVVHELAHIIEKNHSARFYNVIFRYLPDYKLRIKRLKELQRELLFD